MSLVELLVVVAMLSGVMLALFSTLDNFGRATSANFSQNQAQSTARTAIDRIARELRNTGAAGVPDVPIERADPDEFVFNTADPLVQSGGAGNPSSLVRIRYCQDGSSGGLWRQVQTWTTSTRPALPSEATCPHSSYGSQMRVAQSVVNEDTARPLFTYDSASRSEIGVVTVELLVDVDRTRAPGAQRLSTAVSLRNKNRPPVAAFTATVTGSQHVLLNAQTSSDPDGDELTFTWYNGTTYIGNGPLFDYASPTTGTRSFSLTVTDAAGLQDTAPPQTVVIS